MRVKKQILSVCLAIILAVAGIVPAFSVTSYAGTTQYTWEIPLRLTVKEGGSAAAPAHDFEIELHHLDGSKIDLAAFEGEFVQNSPYVETSGIGEYTTILRFRGGEELRHQLSDGFMVILKDSGEDGWVYDEREYEVNARFDGAGIMTEFSIIDCDSGDGKDAAAFECTYTGWYLHFVTNGGSAIGAVSAANGSTIYLSGYTPARDNYTFTGWYEDTALQTSAEKVTLDQETWVYAGWLESEPVTMDYTLTFDTDGGSAIGSVTRTEGTVIDLSTYTPTKTGYTFDGWYEDSTLQTKVTSVTLDQDKTVYAGWTKNTVYHNLYFNTNGGSEISTLRRAEGTVINLSAYMPTRDGYTFTGWYAEHSLKHKVNSVTLDASLTVYAGWEEITYTWEVPIEITVNQGGSESVPGKDFELEVLVNGETVDGEGNVEGIKMDPCSVTTTGNGRFTQTVIFTGDYDAASLVTDGFTIGLADDGEAGWSCDNTVYNVTVNFNWETGEMTDISIEKSVPSQVLLLQSSLLTNVDPAAFTCSYTGWSLTFETNGGSTLDSVSAAAGTAIDLSSYSPTRDGYTFTGWYTDSELITAVDSVTLDGDKTVYAGWKADTETNINQYTLTFETNGGSAIDSVSVEEGTVIDLSDYVPVRDGYTFAGWYAESTLESPVTEVTLTEDRTVYAGWNADVEDPNQGTDTENPENSDSTGADSEDSDTTDADSGDSDTTDADSGDSDTTDANSGNSDSSGKKTSALSSTGSSSQTADTDSSQTGDDSNTALWIVLILICGLGVAVIVLNERKRYRN
ncbi:MAG: InlB B-repeat-containing protein [Clostridiales bacterium]|nr:InlB B-repeat-containing protein [Clostridiales bacterium]